jgi:hypothetical protein
MALPTPEAIEDAKKKVAQAKARLQDLEARANTAKRKLDTRRKIILGGLLIDGALKDERYAETLTELLRRISRDNDKRAFTVLSLVIPLPHQPRLIRARWPRPKHKRQVLPPSSTVCQPSSPK